MDFRAGSSSQALSSRHHVHRERLKADLIAGPARMLQRRAEVTAFGAHGPLPDHVA